MNKIIYQTIIDKHVDILSFDNIFLECNIAQAILFGSKKSGNIHNFKMDVDPRYIYIYILKNFVVEYNAIRWNLKTLFQAFVSKKIENGNLVSFNGQSIVFRLPIKAI